MRRTPVHFAGDILLEEVTAMLHANGFQLRIANNAIVVDRVPHWLKKPEPETNVVKMPARVRKVGR